MRQITTLIILCSLLLSGCEENSSKEESKSNMPDEMPADFNFKLKFGVTKNNGIDTYQDVATKDLVADGAASTGLTLSPEEMAKIYQEMKEINILESKDLIPQTNCMQKPFSVDEWEITLEGETITLNISEQYCDSTEDAKELIELRNYVFSIVKSKEDYKTLPAATGHYE